MRAIDEIVELNYQSFIETYGKVDGNYYQRKAESSHSVETGTDLPKICVTSEDDGRQQQQQQQEEGLKMESLEWNGGANDRRKSSVGVVSNASSYDSGSDSHSLKARSNKQKLRKISYDKLASLGGVIQAAVTSRRPKSHSFSEKSGLSKPKQDRRVSSLVPTSSPHHSRKNSSESGSVSAEEDRVVLRKKNEKARVRERPYSFCASVSPITSFTHKGYLQCRNKKKQWEKCWCVLRDACLYCYQTEQPDVIRKVIPLRGYYVVADVTNLNRSRFVMRLRQHGFPSLYFSCDKHRDFLLWVGSFEKEIKSIQSCDLTTEDNNISKPIHKTSLPNLKTESSSQVDSELLTLQKQKLLKELALQKEQIIEEQKLLEKLDQQICPCSKTSQTSKDSKEQILERHQQETNLQEQKTIEVVTYLNRRRNSCQLKLMQFTKDLAGLSSPKTRESNTKIQATEKKLKEMEEALLLIDREIEEEVASRQHNLERLQRKRDLELLITEQQQAVEHSRRDKKDALRQVDPSMTPSSTRSHDTLESIDEWSDDFVTSSTCSLASVSRTDCAIGLSRVTRQDALCSSSSSSDFSVHHSASSRRESFLNSESPCGPNPQLNDVDSLEDYDSSGEDSGFQPSAPNKINDSYEFYQTVLKNFFPAAEQGLSCLDSDEEESSKESTLKAYSDAKKNEIDSDIMAKIHDFELFAKMKLQETRKT